MLCNLQPCVVHTSKTVIATCPLAAVPRRAKTIRINRFAAAGSSTEATTRDSLQPNATSLSWAQAKPLQQPQQSNTAGADASTADIDAEESVDERERLRRQRISSANKGKVPWNKGRKHSPETIAKIRARTQAAMKRPDVVEKLRSGKPHTAETRAKISSAVKAVKERMRQEHGDDDGEESSPRPGTANRRRKTVKKSLSPEEQAAEDAEKARKRELHRQRISEAIRRKWMDPAYREKVGRAMATREVQAKRTASRKKTKAEHLMHVRQVLGAEHARREEVEVQRRARLVRAQQVVAQCEGAMCSLKTQMQAFSQDPVMQQKANMAMQQAQHMLQLARAQMDALQQGHTPPPAAPEMAQELPPATPPPSPSRWPDSNGQHYRVKDVNGANGHHHASGYEGFVVEAEILVHDDETLGQGERWVLDDDDVPIVASTETR